MEASLLESCQSLDEARSFAAKFSREILAIEQSLRAMEVRSLDPEPSEVQLCDLYVLWKSRVENQSADSKVIWAEIPEKLGEANLDPLVVVDALAECLLLYRDRDSPVHITCQRCEKNEQRSLFQIRQKIIEGKEAATSPSTLPGLEMVFQKNQISFERSYTPQLNEWLTTITFPLIS